MEKGKFDSNAFYERLLNFAKRCRKLTIELPKVVANFEYSKQLIKSSGSMGANYIEALEAMGKRDFIYRLKVSRKETRESVHWLRLIDEANDKLNVEVKGELEDLIREGREVMKIFTASILTAEGKKKLETK
jgi:four helix bundle protein